MRLSAREPTPSLGGNDFEWGWQAKRSRDAVARPHAHSSTRKRPAAVKPVATLAAVVAPKVASTVAFTLAGTEAWTENEDQALVAEIQANPAASWPIIGAVIPGRRAAACRNRWHDTLKRLPQFQHISHLKPLRAKKIADIINEDDLFADHECLEELVLGDEFSFESVLALGAMSHTMQPISTEPPSPGMLESFPGLAHRFSPDLTAYERPITPESPPSKSFTVRVTTRDLKPKNHADISMAATIRPFYDAHIGLTICNSFSEINTLLNTPPKNKASAPTMHTQRNQNMKFNASLVRV